MKPWVTVWFAFVGLGSVLARGSLSVELKSFGAQEGRGFPSSRLLSGRDTRWYGVSASGGHFKAGAIYRMTVDGARYTPVYSFGGNQSDSEAPIPVLVQSTNGILFGMTSRGGDLGGGILFSLNSDGSGFQVVHSFPTETGPSNRSLWFGLDGWLYGTLPDAPVVGSIYRIRPDGSEWSLLVDFASNGGGECTPGPLTQAADGMLFGSAWTRNSPRQCVLFSIRPDGTNYRIVSTFSAGLPIISPTDPVPQVWLTPGADGFLYGALSRTAAAGDEAIFRVRFDGTGFRLIHSFSGGVQDGQKPAGELLLLPGGTLTGVTTKGGRANLGVVFQCQTDGSAYQIVHSFSGGSDGGSPPSGMTFSSDGTYYGTAGDGALYRIRPDGSGYGNLWPDDRRPEEGKQPTTSLTTHTNGFLYGTTSGGGNWGVGAIYRIKSDGSGYQTVYSFPTNSLPAPDTLPLLMGPNGTILGISGTNSLRPSPALFSISASGSGFQVFQTNFSAKAWAKGADGGLYGIRGDQVFQAASDGSSYRTITTLVGSDRLLVALGGRLVVSALGPNGRDSILWSIQLPDGQLGLVHSFGDDSGGGTVSGLIEGADGWLYGVTSSGGTSGVGAIFRVSIDGTQFLPIHDFTRDELGDGLPTGNPTLGTDGFLYGIVSDGTNSRAFRVGAGGQPFGWVPGLVSGTNGIQVVSDMVTAADGSSVGVTRAGGILEQGSLFRILPDFDLAHILSLPDQQVTNGQSYLMVLSSNLFPRIAGLPILEFQVSGLPSGVQLDSLRGQLVGTPTQAGLFNVFVIARTDAGPAAIASVSFRLRVVDNGGWTIQSITRGTDGSICLHGVGAVGATYGVETSALPAGSPWVTVGGVTVGADGGWHFVDLSNGSGQEEFYRLVRP